MNETSAEIALLTPYASVDYVGGVEIFSSQLERALGEVDIFVDPRGSRTASSWSLARVGLEQPYKAFRVARSFLKKHKARPFELVVSNGLCGWPLSPLNLDIPMVQVYHFTLAGLAREALALRGDRLTTGKVAAYFDKLAGRGKHIVAVSPIILQEVKQYYGLSGQVIPNAVDTTLFRRRDRFRAREKLGLPSDATIGLFVGRAEYAKGFDVFLEVARSMREFLFVFVGRCSHVEPNVQVLENVPHSKMPWVYASADFFTLPSRYEGFNLSILEALACDLPIVVSEAAYPFTEDPAPYGYVTSSLRPQEFVRAIREVLNRRSSYAPRETIAATYSFDLFRENWRRLIRMLLEHDGAQNGRI